MMKKVPCVAFGTTKELYFHIDVEYIAYRFIWIPFSGANYTGYGRKDASWGLPELKAFIDRFAALHFAQTGKKPYIGNKAIIDGVKYRPHEGESHAGGYGVDIDFGVETGNAKVGEARYDQKAHEEQIKRYLECGASLVYTADKILAAMLGDKVEEDVEHDNHDHVNVL